MKNLADLITNYNRVQDPLIDPVMIAEAGVNHEGRMDLAKRLIDEAKNGGAEVIKFQTYKAETLASKDSPYYWDITKESTRSQFELFKKYDKFWKKEFEALKIHCDQAGIEFLSTPFDVESALFLNDLMSVFKISSSDLTNRPFIEFIAAFGKPIILSTGAGNHHEVQEAVEWIENAGVPLCLMHCVLNYPTSNANANLGMIRGLRKYFPQHVIGYSDHTLPQDMEVVETAWLLGSVIIEKHFTFDKTLPGNDHYHAMDWKDLVRWKERIKAKRILLGNDERIRSLPEEIPAINNARRSLVLAKSVMKGQALSNCDLTWKRPASGISPRYWYEVLGRKMAVDLEEDTVLQWKHII
ncbi:Acetylneuraminic acid synthetase [Gammaproteobacteria bacterium]